MPLYEVEWSHSSRGVEVINARSKPEAEKLFLAIQEPEAARSDYEYDISEVEA